MIGERPPNVPLHSLGLKRERSEREGQVECKRLLGGFFVHNDALPYILRFGLLFNGTTSKMIGKGAQLSCDFFA
jgi:hypothetical protein